MAGSRKVALNAARTLELVRLLEKHLGSLEALVSMSKKDLQAALAEIDPSIGYRSLNQILGASMGLMAACPVTSSGSTAAPRAEEAPGEDTDTDTDPPLPPAPEDLGGGLSQRDWTTERDTDGKAVAALVPTKKGLLRIPWPAFEWLFHAYSRLNGKAAPVQEIADKLKLTPRRTVEVLRRLDMTHWSLPYTDEKIAHSDPNTLVEEIASDLRADIVRRARSASRAQVNKAAAAWWDLETSLAHAIPAALGHHSAAAHVPQRAMPAAARPFEVVCFLADVHVGKKGYGPHGASLERTRADLLSAVDDLLGRLHNHGRPARIHLVFGGDYCNFDTYAGTTTRGTPQTNDGHPYAILEEVLGLGREVIERFRTVAPLSVYVVPGNHDRLVSYMAGCAWRDYYATVRDVEVHPLRNDRSYARSGCSLLIFAHGDGVRGVDLHALAAVEARELLGQTTHTLALHGHLHSHKRSDGRRRGKKAAMLSTDRGVVLQPVPAVEPVATTEQQPSISGEDEYHDRNGYVGNEAGIAAYLLDLERGRFGYLLGVPAWSVMEVA